MEKTLKISDYDAKKLYPSASKEWKAILENSFGTAFFSEKITDRIKTWEDVCEAAGEDTSNPKWHEGPEDEIGYRKVKLIVKVLNEGWVPDWDNDDQEKYYPWFYMNTASGFSLFVAVYVYSYSYVGSRLCFKSRELATYAATQFLDIYKGFFTK